MKNFDIENLRSLDKGTLLRLKEEFLKTGILVFDKFIDKVSLETIQNECEQLSGEAFKSSSSYNLFVDDGVGECDEVKKRLSKITFKTSKGCVCYDQIDEKNALKELYNNDDFKSTICKLVGLENIFPYADSLSGININYYVPGDSLEWHFDNCNFTITLLIKKAEKGGEYLYFPNERFKSDGSEDYQAIEKMVTGRRKAEIVGIEEGDLVLFRGVESLHKVSEIEEGERVLVTFCYNTKSGISLSETSRKTFFGRID